MRAVFGQKFAVAKLTCFVESVTPSGVIVELARVSSSGTSRTGVGDLAVMFPCPGRRVQMLLAIAPEYHSFDFLRDLRIAVFAALEIAENETWLMKVAPPAKIEFISAPPEGVYEHLAT